MENEKVEGEHYVEELEEREGTVRMRRVQNLELQLTIRDWQREGKEMLRRSKSMPKLKTIDLTGSQDAEDIMDRREDQKLDTGVGIFGLPQEDMTSNTYGSGQDTDMEAAGEVQIEATQEEEDDIETIYTPKAIEAIQECVKRERKEIEENEEDEDRRMETEEEFSRGGKEGRIMREEALERRMAEVRREDRMEAESDGEYESASSGSCGANKEAVALTDVAEATNAFTEAEKSEEMDLDIETMTRGEWEQAGESIMLEVGYTGRRDMALAAMEAEVKRERTKRKRFEGDVGVKEGGDKRKYATPKRQLLREAMKGLMGNKYANIMTVEEQEKRRQERTESEERSKRWWTKKMEGQARERSRREKGKGKEETKGKQEERKDLTPPAQDGRDEMRTEVETLKKYVTRVMARIEALERKLGLFPATPTSKGTWAQVARATTLGETREKEEKIRAGKEEMAEKREEERIRKQRGVIEIIPDSQAEANCEGEELVRLAEEAGITREEIESIKVIRGRMRVKVKEGEERRIVERINKTRPDGKAAARQMESWTGLVVYGIERSWNRKGGMKELKAWFEKGWKVTLMKEPRWLANPKDWRGYVPTAPVVIHVARSEDREKMCERKTLRYVDEEGYTVSKSISKWGYAYSNNETTMDTWQWAGVARASREATSGATAQPGKTRRKAGVA